MTVWNDYLVDKGKFSLSFGDMKQIESYPLAKCRNCMESFRQKRPWAHYCSTRCSSFAAARRREEKVKSDPVSMYRQAVVDHEAAVAAAKFAADYARRMEERLLTLRGRLQPS